MKALMIISKYIDYSGDSDEIFFELDEKFLITCNNEYLDFI